MYFSTIEASMLLKTNETFRKRTQNELKTQLRLDPKIGAKRAILVEFACGNNPTRGVTGGYIDSMPNRDERRKLTEDMHGLSRRPTICLGQPLAPRPRAPESCHLPGHSGVDL